MDLEFPVGDCPYCGVRGPMFIDKIDIAQFGVEGAVGQVEIIICPECDKIINSDKDIEIEWFGLDHAKYFGYKVVENE